jgi:hypothetical protein
MLNKPIPRWLPRVRLYERPQPEYSAFASLWMSDQLKAQSGARPGQNVGARWIYPSLLDEQKFDGDPGEPSHLKAAALTLDYSIQWLPSRLGGAFGWVRLSTPQEAAFRAIDRAIAQNEIERLQEELKDKPDDEDLKAQLLTAETTFLQLSDGKEGYCRTGEYLLDTKTSGLFWGLNAPNVPVRFVSSFVLPQDGAFSLRLRRDQLPAGQVEGTYSVTLFNDKGSKSTCYRIAIGDDGNASEFFHYRSMSRKEREALQSQLDEVEARGRLTAIDHAQIKLYKEQQEAIKATAKKEGRKEPSREEKAEIELLDAQARALKESKKLTAGDRAEKAEVEKKLFIEREPFTLQEDAQSLLGGTLDITVQFLRAGNVVVRCNDSEYVYTNKRAQDAAARRRYGSYTTQIPDGARIQLDSNGGMWGLVYGRPNFNSSALVLTQPFEIPNGANVDDAQVSFDGDTPAGTSVDADLVEAPDARGRALYQLLLRLSSETGRFTPEVYRVDFRIPAAVTSEYSDVTLWDSQEPGAPFAVSGNRIIDVVVESDRARTLQAKVIVPTEEIPSNTASLACDVRIHDRWEETGDENHDTMMLRMGKVATDKVNRAKELTEEGVEALHGAMSELAVVGPDQWLDKEIAAAFACDGLRVGTALRMLYRDAGIPPSLYEDVEEDSGPLIEGGVPGTWPRWIPGVGVRYLEFAQTLIRDCAPGWQQFITAEGIKFARWNQRDKTAKNYRSPPDVDVSSPLCLRGEVTLTQDVSEYLTSITIIGDRDTLTGQRYGASETLPLGDDPQFFDSLYFIGEKRHETRRAGDLQSETACLLAAREALGITPLTPDGLAPWFVDGQISFDPDFFCGDLIRVTGWKFLVDTISFGSLNAEEDSQKLRFRARLAQDVRIAS